MNRLKEIGDILTDEYMNMSEVIKALMETMEEGEEVDYSDPTDV